MAILQGASRFLIACVVGLSLAFPGLAFPGHASATGSALAFTLRTDPSAPQDARDISGPGTLAWIHFTENRGQVRNQQVLYYASAGGVQIGLTRTGTMMQFSRPASARPRGNVALGSDPSGLEEEPTVASESTVVRTTFVGASPVGPQGREALPVLSNYLLGSNPAAWRVGVRSYQEVAYGGLYPGIDLVYRADEVGLKYSFIVHPGADPNRIRWSYAGVTGLEVEGGTLSAHTALGDIRDASPYAYQTRGPARCGFTVTGFLAGFDCDAWEPAETLVIDPLIYSTYLGGSGNDRGLAITVDASGSAYVAGYTASIDFPATPSAYGRVIANPNSLDAFVAKVDPSGTSLRYATYLGGTSSDRATAIAVDASGAAHIAGTTSSADFPTTPGALRTTFQGAGTEAFVAALDPNGSALLYSTFLGGSVDDRAYAIALDSSRNAYVTGRTKSADFPSTAGTVQPTFAAGLCGGVPCSDGFVAKLSAAGTALVYATFLGGTNSDRGLGIAVDAAGDAFVAGYTNSTDFPATLTAFGPRFHGGLCGSSPCSDAFVAKLNPTGTAFAYSTFLGGTKDDRAHAVEIDPIGNAYVTGNTNSTDFPTTVGAYESIYPGTGNRHAFVAKVSATGTALAYATFLGGLNSDGGNGIAVDSYGNAYVTGLTNSTDFPTTLGAYDRLFNGATGNDAFLAELNEAGSVLWYSTFLGGGADDWGNALVLDAAGDVYMTGHTFSTNFPTTAGVVQPALMGVVDAFVTRLSPTYSATVTTVPTGLQIVVDGATYTSPANFAWRAGSRHRLLAPSPQSVLAGNRAIFASWSDGGSQVHTVAVGGPATYTASFGLQYDETVDTLPSGLTVRIDGSWYAAPQALWWDALSMHTVSANATQNGLVFSAWSDGGSMTHAVSAVAPATLIAFYATPVLTRCTVTPDPAAVQVTGTLQFAAHAWNGSLEISMENVTWSVGGGVGTIDATGLFRATSPGSGVASAQVARTGRTASCFAAISVTPGAAPTVTITAPASGTVVQTTVTVDGTSTHATLVQVRVDAEPWRNATGLAPWSLTWDLTTYPDGAHTLEARAWNGTVESTRDAVTIQKATPTPAFCTVAPDAVTLFVGGTQAFAAHLWNGTAEVLGISVAWSVDGNIGTVTATGKFTATAPGAGHAIATVTHVGTSYVCSAVVTVLGGAPPTVMIASPANGTVIVLSSILIRGTSSAATDVQVRAGTGAWIAATGALIAWRATLDLTAFPLDQVIPIEARAWNGTVESPRDSTTVIRRLPLELTVVHPSDHSHVSGVLRVDGIATEGSTVQLRLDGGPWVNVAVAGGEWNSSIDTAGLFEGDHLIEAKAVRGADETAIISRMVTVDRGFPPSTTFPILQWPLVLFIAIVVSFLILFALLERRRKREAETALGRHKGQHAEEPRPLHGQEGGRGWKR